MFPKAKPRGTLRVEGKQNSLFHAGPVIKCFVIPPNSKIEKTAKNNLFDALVLVAAPTVGLICPTKMTR